MTIVTLHYLGIWR